MAPRKRNNKPADGSWQPIGPGGTMVWVPSGTLNPSMPTPGPTTTTTTTVPAYPYTPPTRYVPPPTTTTAPSRPKRRQVPPRGRSSQGTETRPTPPTTTTVPKATTTTVSPTTTTTVPSPTTTVPKSSPSTTVPATPKPAPTTKVDTPAPASTGTKTKPSGKTTKTKKTTKKTTETNSDAWKTIVQQEFGSMWDIYNDNADVKAVIDKSVKEGWYNDKTKLTAELQNTNWYRTTESSARRFMIQQSSDPATVEDNIQSTMVTLRAQAGNSGIVLSDNSLRMLATNKLKFGWTDQQLTTAVGSEAVATAQLNGPQGMADLRRGQVQTKLRKIADNYAQQPTQQMLDDWTKQIMTGATTDTQFTDLMRMNASTQFRSLQPQLDKGVDVKTALNTYTNTAQQVLGVDPATIDWTQDKWNKALNYQDPKTNEYRPMDSWEWNKYLRSLPEWQETDNAKRIYRNAAFTLAQAFGKTT